MIWTNNLFHHILRRTCAPFRDDLVGVWWYEDCQSELCPGRKTRADLGVRAVSLPTRARKAGRKGQTVPASFFYAMKQTLTTTIDLEIRLQLLGLSPKKTALILGYIPSRADIPENKQIDYIGLFEKNVKLLQEQEISTFIFPFWATFEKAFLQAALNCRRKHDRYLLITEANYDLPDEDHYFDEVITGADLMLRDNEDLYELVLRKCRTIWSYQVENIIPHESILHLAIKKKKRLQTTN